MKAVIVATTLMLYSACAAPDKTLDQDFFGRWEGVLTFNADPLHFQAPISFGLNIDKTEGWLNICYLPDMAQMGSLTGEGHGETLEVYGHVTCPPVAIPGVCAVTVFTWTYAALLLESNSMAHTTVSGFVEGCDLAPTSFLAIGELNRISH